MASWADKDRDSTRGPGLNVRSFRRTESEGVNDNVVSGENDSGPGYLGSEDG